MIDWTIADTCLDLYNWMKFEDIFANLYIVKGIRVADKRYGRKFGQRQYPGFKYFLGGATVAGLTILLWFPLLLMSIPGTTKINPVHQIQVSLEMQGFDPFYVQDLPQEFIGNYTNEEFAQLKSTPGYQYLFPSFYSASNMQRAAFDQSSMSVWQITPPARQRLIQSLNSTAPMYLSFSYELERNDPSLPTVIRGFQKQPVTESLRKLFLGQWICRSLYLINYWESVYVCFLRIIIVTAHLHDGCI